MTEIQIPKNATSFEITDAHRSFEKRKALFEQFENLPKDEQPDVACALLACTYKDLREAVLEYCTSDVVSTDAWMKSIDRYLLENKWTKNADWCQSILVLMQRMESQPTPAMTSFCQSMLDAEDPDVRYQAFCYAELTCTCGEEYLKRVRSWLHDQDEDFRIVAIQALARLAPDWAVSELAQQASRAFGVEAFHIVLTQIRLCHGDARGEWIDKLVYYVGDERFSFAAIQTLAEYGDARAIPALLKVAKSFFGEPTTRVAAAGAAAKLGSEKGRKILLKFATSGHGNPKYAEQLLDALDKSRK